MRHTIFDISEQMKEVYIRAGQYINIIIMTLILYIHHQPVTHAVVVMLVFVFSSGLLLFCLLRVTVHAQHH